MSLSFRRQIRRSTLALIAVILVTFDIAVYTGFHQTLHHYVDSKLESTAEGWADIARRNLAVLLDAAQKGQDAEVDTAIPNEGEQIELRDAALSIELLALDGTILWKGAAVTNGPPANPRFLEAARAGEHPFATVRSEAGTSIRRVWVPITQQGAVQYILQAETPLRFLDQALNGLLVVLVTASLGIAVLAWWASNWLTHQTLIPIEVLSATAMNITQSSSLITRLSLKAGYEEFQHLAEAFNAMMDRIQRMVESQRRFVADAAHEIQTPLTALKGNLEVAFRKNRRASEYRETLIANLTSVERLMNLCRSLITLTRLAAADLRPVMKPVPLNPLLEELIGELQVIAEDRGIALTLEGEPALCALGNPEQLHRVFLNLLDNAIRHTPTHGRVHVHLKRERSRVEVAVSDTGEGIPPEHLPRIFDRFYRVDTSRSQEQGGAGLGLAIVKEIADAHGATIHVESVLGKGSCFTISFPRSAFAPVHGHRATSSDEAASAAGTWR
ncbi:MAG TPA: ATP-binding protein [Nitrospira sp.]|nr:ATP-binding protein [Nitrospira sp.]